MDMDNIEGLSNQRLDYTIGPKGEVIANLTVTLGDGSVYRYAASSDEDELAALGAAFGTAELRAQEKIAGHELSEEEIAGWLDSIVKGVKSVVGAVKKVAASKVFKAASKGLSMVAPALGPFAPAAMAVAGGMQVASKLSTAALAAEAGAKNAARMLRNSAKKTARRIGKGSKRASRFFGMAARWAKKARKISSRGRKRRKPKRKKETLAAAKRRRKRARASAIAKSKKAQARRRKSKKPIVFRGVSRARRRQPTAAPRRRTERAPTRAPTRAPSKMGVVAAARAGRLRSNQPGKTTPETLIEASETNRVFWIV